MNQIKIGEFLKSLRKEKNLTQQEAADALYVSQKTISRWETGEGIPDISVIQEVALFYGVTVDELLNGERKEVLEKNITFKKCINEDKHEKGLKKINTYFFVSLGIMLFFLMVGVIFYCTLTPAVLVIVCPIALGVGVVLYVYGYNDIRDIIEEPEKIKVIKKNVLFSDITFIYIILYSLLVMGVV